MRKFNDAIRIPRSVKAWLFLFGFWGGSLTTFALLIIGSFGSWAIVLFGISLVLWNVIGWRYAETLEKWGLIERKKRK